MSRSLRALLCLLLAAAATATLCTSPGNRQCNDVEDALFDWLDALNVPCNASLAASLYHPDALFYATFTTVLNNSVAIEDFCM
jgi:hypothetical protein